MKVLMLSTDRKLLDPHSAVSKRTRAYGEFCESMTVVVAGVGAKSEVRLDEKVRIVFPGGLSKAHNFFSMLKESRGIAKQELPSIVTLQDPFFVGVIGIFTARAAKAPLQVQIHTNYFSRAFIFESLRHAVQFCLAAIVLPFASCVRVVTVELAHKVRAYTTAPISVLPIYTDMSKFHHKHHTPDEYTERPIILTVSRLAPEKRIDLVIRALVRLPKAHLYILGDGTERAALEQEVQQCGVSERVHFLGWRDDPTAYYQHADCFVQMSAYEGYGVSLVEALASGVPIITTDVGVVAELPIDAVTIVEPTEYALARALSTTLDSISETRQRQHKARTSFLQNRMNEKEYIAEYKKLLETCGS